MRFGEGKPIWHGIVAGSAAVVLAWPLGLARVCCTDVPTGSIFAQAASRARQSHAEAHAERGHGSHDPEHGHEAGHHVEASGSSPVPREPSRSPSFGTPVPYECPVWATPQRAPLALDSPSIEPGSDTLVAHAPSLPVHEPPRVVARFGHWANAPPLAPKTPIFLQLSVLLT